MCDSVFSGHPPKDPRAVGQVAPSRHLVIIEPYRCDTAKCEAVCGRYANGCFANGLFGVGERAIKKVIPIELCLMQIGPFPIGY
ncbi:hypothetical protein EYF80_026871 [Liparis tanakae]|uniref:Uncharacterized protein n=1 Tax=Liparis tanakae TaxID=230148 RepID=A0A4Z2HAS9_9TELE|nr:hypothetical protein EYF80_026871 [Liparis tanakae]